MSQENIDYTQLLQILEQKADAAFNPIERDDYEMAVEALRHWQKNGGSLPDIVQKYHDLLPGGLVQETGSTDNNRNSQRPPSKSDDTHQPILSDQAVTDDRLETPEEKSARRELDKAEHLLEEGLEGNVDALKQVLGLATQLLQRPTVMAEAQILQAQAQESINQLVNEAIKQGDDANEQGDFETARDFYERAKMLDSQNREVLERLAELNRQITTDLSEDEIRRLRLELQNRRDLQQLEKAVYHAEMLDLEGKLTAELVSLLQDARAEFDQARQSMGKQTTMMRFGDLRARLQARDDIEDRLINNEETIWDSTTDTYRRTSEVLKEAEVRWKEGSEDTAQYEIARIERALPEHPRWAQERLGRVLAYETDPETGETIIDSRRNEPRPAYPFFTEHRRLLEQKQEEIQRLIEQQDEAELLMQQADDNKTAARQLLLRAFGIFPYASGLRDWLRREQQTAVNILLREIESCHTQGRQSLKQENYESTSEFLKQAANAETQLRTIHDDYIATFQALSREKRIPEEWLEEERWQRITEQLEELTARSNLIRQELEGKQLLFREYEGYANDVRQQIKDPGARTAAIERFDQRIEPEEKFHIFEDYRRLRDELVQYRDVNDNLTQARIARDNREWERLRQLTQTMLTEAVSGALREEIEQLDAQARQELAIQQLREKLRQGDPQAASVIWNKLQETSSEKEALHERLQVEIEALKAAQENTEAFQDLYDKASSLARSGDVLEQLQALHIFRYIGGDRTEIQQEGWPAYRLSMLTATAREKALELRQAIREQTIDSLLAAYNESREREPVESIKQLAQMAALSRGLHEAHLLENESERTAVRFFIVAQTTVTAKSKEEIGNWDEAVALWESLNRQYPGEGEDQLRWARIQQAIAGADLSLRQDVPEAALKTLEAAQRDPDMSHAWQIELKLSEVYTRLAQKEMANPAGKESSHNYEAEDYFRRAFNCLSVAGRHREGQEIAERKRRELERERFISETLYKTETKRAEDAKQALIILQTALQNDLAVDSERLKRLRASIYTELSAHKLNEANQKKASGGANSKIEAVMALVDLRDIELIAEIEESKRQADKELKPLQSELAPSAEAVIEEAELFKPRYSLINALKQARELDGRLQAFSEIQTLFESDELERLRDSLMRNRTEIGAQVTQLTQLERLLEEADNPQLWRQAVATGNFEPLEEKQAQIEALNLKEISEVKNFGDKLTEWKSLYKYLQGIIGRIRHEFVYKNNFNQIYRELRQLNTLPPTLPGSNFPLRYIDDDVFRLIRNNLDRQFAIHDLHGNTISGWTNVEQAARERAEEMAEWESWADQWQKLNEEVERAWKLCQSHTPATALNVKRENWQRFIDAANRALEKLQTLPEKDGVPLQPRNQIAEGLEKLAQQQRGGIESNLLQIELEMQGDNRQFPAKDTWARAAKTVRELERLIREAKTIGPATDEERQRLEHYELVALPKLKAKREKKGIFNRLLGR